MADMMPPRSDKSRFVHARQSRIAVSYFVIPRIILLTVFATMVQSAMDTSAKYAMLTATPAALIFYSGLIVSCRSFAFGYAQSGFVFLHTNFKWLMAIRSLFGCLGSVFFILGFNSLPLADAFVIASLTPVVAAILGYLLFHERVNALTWPAMFISTIGVAIMFLDVVPEMRLGYIYIILGVLGASSSMVITRHICKSEKQPMAMILWPSVLMTLGACAYIIINNMTLEAQALEYIYIYARLLLFGRWLTIYLVNHISVHLMAAIFNIQFVWFVIIGYIVFADVPSDMMWLGAAILIGATTAVAMYEYRAARV